jgi:ubiquinone/menaquinone biosynthesis C-methylase UbiE
MSVEKCAIAGKGLRLHFWLMSLSYKLRDLVLPRTEILKEAGIEEGYRVLDFGCGPGSYVLPVSRLVGERGVVYAVDKNPLAIATVNRLIAKNRLTNVRTILSDCNTGLPTESIDVVLLYDVIHDLGNRRSVLAELHRVLRRQGVLSVSDHHLTRGDIICAVSDGGLFELSTEGRRTYRFTKTVTEPEEKRDKEGTSIESP